MITLKTLEKQWANPENVKIWNNAKYLISTLYFVCISYEYKNKQRLFP